MAPREITEHSVVMIDEDAIVESLRSELPQVIENKQSQQKSCTIYRVRPILRSGNEATYTPKLVAIGPYHSSDDELKDMQEVKLKYLGDLVQRSRRNSLENFVGVVKANAEEAMRQYSGIAADHEAAEFVKMLVADGCFIIEFLVKWYLNDKMGQANAVKAKLPALRNDLLLVENQIPFKILEALFKAADVPQLDSAVVKEDDDDEGEHRITIAELALFFFLGDRVCAEWMAQLFGGLDGQSFHHLLHLYHSSLNPFNHRDMHFILKHKKKMRLIGSSAFVRTLKSIFFRFRVLAGDTWDPLDDHTTQLRRCLAQNKVMLWVKTIVCFPFAVLRSITSKICGGLQTMLQLVTINRRRRRRRQWLMGIPNARYLRDTGFKFARKADTLCLLDVSRRGRSINIPVLSIDDNTLIHFQNLIAFEYTTMEYGTRFTAYATLMDSLIDTAEDVAILRERGIVENRLGDDDKVADFFNSLHRGIYVNHDHHYLSPLFDYVTRYYSGGSWRFRLYRWRSKFVPDYFSNPWAVPSMIAAFFLLVFAVAQTVYTIYPYYHPRSN